MTKMPELLEMAIASAGGQELWDTLRGLKADVSINGPVWGLKGWPPGESFDQVLTVDDDSPVARHEATAMR